MQVHNAAARVFQLETAARADLGEQFHAARKAKALNQPALSAAAGIQQSEISRIESGAANPTIATINKLADETWPQALVDAAALRRAWQRRGNN